MGRSVDSISAGPAPPELSLVLAGGNALGAYHLGACEVLLGAGHEPEWLVGTSIGAVTAAILAGNAPEHRFERLNAFWRQARQLDLWPLWGESFARASNLHALSALIFGRPGLFGGRFPGLLSLFPGMPGDLAIRDHAPMARTLERLIDFDRLNSGERRVSMVAVDIEAGAEVWFDTRDDQIAPDHLLACTALAPLFPPVEIDGRLLCDAGFANNLPIDRVFSDRSPVGKLCVAVDLFSAPRARPATLDETCTRAQDLVFAMQTLRSIEHISRQERLLREIDAASPPSILAHLAHSAPGADKTLKALDFSGRSLRARAACGAADMTVMLERIAAVESDDALTYLGPR